MSEVLKKFDIISVTLRIQQIIRRRRGYIHNAIISMIYQYIMPIKAINNEHAVVGRFEADPQKRNFNSSTRFTTENPCAIYNIVRRIDTIIHL